MDREALEACAEALVGTHDFTAFTPTQTDHVHFDRKIFDAAWTRDGDILDFQVTADAFMRNMVRVLVGNHARSLLRPPNPGQLRATPTWRAPPRRRHSSTHGLYLESVSSATARALRLEGRGSRTGGYSK